jgi:four helix bundle protein
LGAITAEMRDFSKVEAWRLADDLAVAIYECSRDFPRAEIYGITSQIGRAVISVPANIAEGSGRQSKKDYLHFLYIARGSLSENQYLVHLSGRLGYVRGTRPGYWNKRNAWGDACMASSVRSRRKSPRCTARSRASHPCSF